MVAPRVLVLRAPGTNCDAETAYAFEMVGADVSSIHINRLIEDSQLGRGFQILCFPGGFSYGDDIAAGRILAQRLQVHLRDLVDEFRGRDRLVLGICNGFQVMMRLGIFFPGESQSAGQLGEPQVEGELAATATQNPMATLALNHHGRFEDRWVHLANADSNSVFLNGIETMYLPMAHAEGRFVFRDSAAVENLKANGQLGLRYTDASGTVSESVLDFPDNPNGAELNVAGISDSTGRVFGLMPHPERHMHPTHHPFWTRRRQQPEYGEGRAMFLNAVNYFG